MVVVQTGDLAGLISRFNSSLPCDGELLYFRVEKDAERLAGLAVDVVVQEFGTPAIPVVVVSSAGVLFASGGVVTVVKTWRLPTTLTETADSADSSTTTGIRTARAGSMCRTVDMVCRRGRTR